MTEAHQSKQERIELFSVPYTRYDRQTKIEYVSDDRIKPLNIQLYPDALQIGAYWASSRGISFFLGAVNRQLELLEDGIPKSVNINIRSTFSEKNPARLFMSEENENSNQFLIPFSNLSLTPPFSLDDLVQEGHYSYDAETDKRLKFVRVNSPRGPFIWSHFDPESSELIERLLPLENETWHEDILHMGEFIDTTSGFMDNLSSNILFEMIKREFL